MSDEPFNRIKGLGLICNHVKCVPVFDAEKAKTMSADEIRKAYPRFEGRCPDCDTLVIIYADLSQYIGGDW